MWGLSRSRFCNEDLAHCCLPGPHLVSEVPYPVDAVIAVYGEDPYAEFQGDRENLDFEPNGFDVNLLAEYQSEDIPVVSVFLSGRPMWTNPELNNSDAFVLKRAENHNIRSVVFTANELKNGKVLAILKEQNIDFIVLAGFMKLIPAQLVAAARNGGAPVRAAKCRFSHRYRFRGDVGPHSTNYCDANRRKPDYSEACYRGRRAQFGRAQGGRY